MNELREALETAYEEEEEAGGGQETEESTAQGSETPEPTSEEGVVDEVETEEVATEEAEEQEPGSEDVREEVREEPKEKVAGAQAEKAPASWSPKAREGWGKLPDEAKSQVLKREKEVNQVLQDSSSARNFTSKFSQLMGPYRESMIASGAQNPLQAVGTLLQKDAAMRAGTPAQKAQAVASMISDYGINIEMLDGALSGNPNIQAESPNASLESLIDQRMAPMNEYLNQQKYQQQMAYHQSQNDATNSVSQFSETAEFINDVKADMADLLDMSAARGQEMSLQQAYDKACAINPDISSVLQQRASQQRIMGGNKSMASKRAAAASLTGKQGGAGGGTTGGTMREMIEQSWDEQVG